MAEFNFSWESKISQSVWIEADSEKEAYHKWAEGHFGNTDIDDEVPTNNYVKIDNCLYYGDKYEKVNFSRDC